MFTVAVAGRGDVAKYVVQEPTVLASPPKVVLISREVRPWFDQHPEFHVLPGGAIHAGIDIARS